MFKISLIMSMYRHCLQKNLEHDLERSAWNHRRYNKVVLHFLKFENASNALGGSRTARIEDLKTLGQYYKPPRNEDVCLVGVGERRSAWLVGVGERRSANVSTCMDAFEIALQTEEKMSKCSQNILNTTSAEQ